MKKAFFVLARTDSSRLPAKAFLQLAGSTLLGCIIDQLKRHQNIPIIVLTSDQASDDELADFSLDQGCMVHRGSLHDVASRITGAIEAYDVDAFFRVNGDSPCIDYTLIKKAATLFDRGDYDFVSNLLKRSFPYGVAVELFSSHSYLQTQCKFETDHDKEHPTSFFYRNSEIFSVGGIEHEKDYSGYSLTVDTYDDYIYMRKLVRLEPRFLMLNLEEKIELIRRHTP